MQFSIDVKIQVNMKRNSEYNLSSDIAIQVNVKRNGDVNIQVSLISSEREIRYSSHYGHESNLE